MLYFLWMKRLKIYIQISQDIIIFMNKSKKLFFFFFYAPISNVHHLWVFIHSNVVFLVMFHRPDSCLLFLFDIPIMFIKQIFQRNQTFRNFIPFELNDFMTGFWIYFREHFIGTTFTSFKMCFIKSFFCLKKVDNLIIIIEHLPMFTIIRNTWSVDQLYFIDVVFKILM